MMNMKQLLKNLMSEDSGQDLIEYTLLAALIALVAIASVGALGKTVNNVFNNVDTSLSNVGH
jgi:pilus assembly protein Flp/PilA